MSVTFVLGTRPEITKTLGVISALSEQGIIPVNALFSGQQTTLVENTINEYPEFDDVRTQWAGDSSIANFDPRWREKLASHLIATKSPPSLIVSTGDTNTVLEAAKIANSLCVPFLHLEAGIRHNTSRNLEPEEQNRRLISPLASYHYCPTAAQQSALVAEGIPVARTFVIGDLSKVSISTTWKRLLGLGTWKQDSVIARHFKYDKRLCLCTFHRSTSLANLQALELKFTELVGFYPDFRFVVCARPDTRWEQFYSVFKSIENVDVIEAPAPLAFQKLLAISDLVLTDSAGVQQEAALFEKPCVALRENIELGVTAPLLRVVAPRFQTLQRDFHHAAIQSRIKRPTRISQTRLEGEAVSRRAARMIEKLVLREGLYMQEKGR